jgi:hypothetical protein
MPRIRSQLIACGLALSVGACTHQTRPEGPGAVRGSGVPPAAPLSTPAGQPATASSTPNMSLKRVTGKAEPATLVAVDRTTCTVTPQRFRDTKIGDKALCDWRAGDRQP